MGVRLAAARLALGVEMEAWKLNKARGPCLLALELGPTHHQLALDSVVRRATESGEPQNPNMKNVLCGDRIGYEGLGSIIDR